MLLAVSYMSCIWFVGACILWSDWLLIRKKSDYVLYMTIRGERREDEDVKRIVKEYKAAVWKFMAFIFVLSLGCFLWGTLSSLQVWYLTACLTVVILGDYRVIKKYVGKMYELKKEKGWCNPQKQANCEVDTVVSRMKKTLPVSETWMFVPIWICVASFLWWALCAPEYKVLLIFPGMNVAVMLFFFYLFHRAAHGKLRVYSEDSDINYALNRTAKRAWTGCVVLEATLLCGYQLLLMVWLHAYMSKIAVDGALRSDRAFWGVFLGLSLLVTILFVLIFFRASARVKKAKKELSTGCEEFWKEDEDACWKNGYYYNPQDTNAFVENRSYGMTTNMATAWGKITTWVLLGTLILCFGLGLGLLPLDFGTVTVVKQEDGLVLKGCWYYKETIPFDEVKEVTLFEECPGLSRIWGSGMEHVALGDYHFKGYGSGKAMVYREAEYFILVEKRDGDLVMFSVEDSPEMLECYEVLKGYERAAKAE
ncbi:MAG: PH domain-containing protein [Lachnospiraceae bacterium]